MIHQYQCFTHWTIWLRMERQTSDGKKLFVKHISDLKSLYPEYIQRELLRCNTNTLRNRQMIWPSFTIETK